MLERIDESKKLKTEADAFHRLFLETKEKMRPIQDEFSKVSNHVKQLKDDLREEEEKERKHGEEALREKLEKQAREKLKRGEKLSWEEFQLLGEDGVKAQD